jgi:hypothetical protein
VNPSAMVSCYSRSSVFACRTSPITLPVMITTHTPHTTNATMVCARGRMTFALMSIVIRSARNAILAMGNVRCDFGSVGDSTLGTRGISLGECLEQSSASMRTNHWKHGPYGFYEKKAMQKDCLKGILMVRRGKYLNLKRGSLRRFGRPLMFRFTHTTNATAVYERGTCAPMFSASSTQSEYRICKGGNQDRTLFFYCMCTAYTRGTKAAESFGCQSVIEVCAKARKTLAPGSNARHAHSVGPYNVHCEMPSQPCYDSTVLNRGNIAPLTVNIECQAVNHPQSVPPEKKERKEE